MTLRGLEQRLLEALCVRCPHAEFRKLKAEKMQEMKDARKNGDGSNFNGLAGEYSGHKAIIRCIVLDKSGIPGKGGLNPVQRKIGRGFESGVLALVRW